MSDLNGSPATGAEKSITSSQGVDPYGYYAQAYEEQITGGLTESPEPENATRSKNIILPQFTKIVEDDHDADISSLESGTVLAGTPSSRESKRRDRKRREQHRQRLRRPRSRVSELEQSVKSWRRHVDREQRLGEARTRRPPHMQRPPDMQHRQSQIDECQSLIRYPGTFKTPIKISEKRKRLKATLTEFVPQGCERQGNDQLGSRLPIYLPSTYYHNDPGGHSTQQLNNEFAPVGPSINLKQPAHQSEPPKWIPTHQYDTQNIHRARHHSLAPQSNNQMVLYRQTPIAKSVPIYNQNLYSCNQGPQLNTTSGYRTFQQGLNSFQPSYPGFKNNQTQNMAGPGSSQQNWNTSQIRYPDLQNFQQQAYTPNILNTSFNNEMAKGEINQYNNFHYPAHAAFQYPQPQYRTIDTLPLQNHQFQHNNTQLDHKFPSNTQDIGHWAQPQHLGVDTYDSRFNAREWQPKPTGQTNADFQLQNQENFQLQPQIQGSTGLLPSATFHGADHGGNYSQEQNQDQVQQQHRNNTKIQDGYTVQQNPKRSTTSYGTGDVGNYNQNQDQTQQHRGNNMDEQNSYAVPQNSNALVTSQNFPSYTSPGGSYQQI
ncbi:hypothetical protein GLAREA_04012 [Glarea lozoyensis ATCC 20868]|uniref:Uncharacterized protein n=1 Tax=Glarea lozoyensis (strain ATCC 20868 / MF5171) TaxID=1116229 RepID=S3CZJ8_GLAL2|nr:uncharacterized protein GLAREA_04012 [Glarea lozoyensis ATCC 20868]EPE31045.1 hypothetical protein GLAREA_04012 [Glarea lozoyensis ATCC 20868]